ncbi:MULTISPECIES: DEAD/DEAH box helicase [Bacteroides]|uniref:DEAD/DEAH box helicase n=1 Tax=Bacteroides vicugnae TaxID=3037989 RepID=A0ABU5HLB8_9BACE|nr:MULTISPECIES: DEAD/DEAH box helicase [Bacteroides]MDC2613300.1 DEAD/DEAH box helicase [Bacteroides ovatus]MDC2632289.1 DEAD/DEAH box helicase [Bacteroides ovatus]MDY7251917.1 DEAD/DEAH box helicase [Bacteroides sp. A1-P5]MDY7256372.1 DEAD/DEAH box helicase [Bacteroides sp. A2-P53]
MFLELCRLDHTLRNYQQEAKEKIFGQWDYVDNVLYQMPTGTGKTRLFTSLIRDLSLASLQENRRKGILIIAHRTELIEQIDESLNKYRIPHGIIAGAFKDRRDFLLPVQVASIQTITHPSNRQLAEAFHADFIIIDEAHHATAQSYTKLWNYYPESKKLGVTATPWRMDGRGFKGNFDTLIPSMPIKEFLEKGWLAPYKYYSVPIDSTIRSSIESINEFGIDGDYKTSALEQVVDTRRIRAQLLDSYFEFVKGKKGIIYSISRKHSKHICSQFLDAGIKIADIDSETPAHLRKRLVQNFKNGDLDIIVNVDIFSEGFDCPDLEFVQLARPTRSLVKYIQQVGRGLRRNGDKQCLILDNVGMYGRFGLPDDNRPWEQYFEGGPSSSIRQLRNKTDRDNLGLRTSCERDLSEGLDEMKLIQQVDIETESGIMVILRQEDTDESLDNIEVRSSTIYAKYNIVETNEEYFIENIRNNKRQLLCGLSGRKSISIKLMKKNNEPKGFTIISSFNRNSKPSVNDRIIGYLYREGRIIRFATWNRETIVDVKI